MPEGLLGALDWISANPLITLLALLTTVALEGFFILGLFIPGTVLMFAAGAIVAAGALPLLPMLLAATAGAVLGDGLSFILGRRFRNDLLALFTRWRIPGALMRGERFFQRHGANSIVLGRFIGPLRPLVPAIAGAAGMRPAVFICVDLLAAALWAPLYAMPGLIIGATITVAAEVATRLALVLTLIVVAVWGLWWLIRFAVWLLQERAERWIARIMDWSHRHRRLGRLGPALADPDQPETPVLLACLASLLLIGWLFGVLIWGWSEPRPPAADEWLFDWAAGLRFPGLPAAVSTLSALGSWPSVLSLALSGLLLFSGLRMPRAAAHWLAGGVGAWLLGLILPGAGSALAPGAISADAPVTLLLAVLLSTLLGLIATRHPPVVRSVLYAFAGIIVGLVTLAKLITGHAGASQLALGLVLGLTWTSLLLLGYRRHLRGSPPAPLALSLWIGVLALTVPTTLNWDRDLSRLRKDQSEMQMAGKLEAWRGQDLNVLPTRINLVWAEPMARIEARLAAAGWQPSVALTRESALRWLGDETAPTRRPPLPQALAGELPSLELELPGTPTQGALLLRLWQTRQYIPDAGPVWHGSVGELVERRWLGLLRFPLMRPDARALSQLHEQLGIAARVQPRTGGPITLIIAPAAR